MARKKKTKPPKSSIKGKILEMVVAELHENPNIKVERNVRLPTVRNPARKREIDVLVSGSFAGYPTRIAIECKNRANILDVEFIDAFIGKLNDVGIPTQQGIFVSPIGFTKGAIERADEVGITTLIFQGLTSDRLSEKIDKAIQSVIYLIAEITSLSVACNIKETENSFQLWFLYDQEKIIQGSIPELIWKQWINERLPSTLGEHEVEVIVPDEMRLYVDGRLERVISAKAKIKIVGLHISIVGEATQHSLINPSNQKSSKFKTTVKFDVSQRSFPVTTLDNEDDLQKFLKQRSEVIKLTIGRMRLPRIRFYSLYWPLSERAIRVLTALIFQCQAEGRKLSEQELASIEGSDLNAIWDPIWSKNPMIKREDSRKE